MEHRETPLDWHRMTLQLHVLHLRLRLAPNALDGALAPARERSERAAMPAVTVLMHAARIFCCSAFANRRFFFCASFVFPMVRFPHRGCRRCFMHLVVHLSRAASGIECDNRQRVHSQIRCSSDSSLCKKNKIHMHALKMVRGAMTNTTDGHLTWRRSHGWWHQTSAD